MLNLKNWFLLFASAIGFTMPLGLIAQCQIVVSNLQNPSSCYAIDGSFNVISVNNSCNREIRVYKNNILISQGSGTLTVAGQGSGLFEIVSPPDCGCSASSATTATLFSGTATPLTPYVNKGSGFYQTEKVFVCRGSNLQLGVQSLGITGLRITGPEGYDNSAPNGSSFWNLTNMQPSKSGRYTITYRNGFGCISTTFIMVNVGNLSVNAGSDVSACVGTRFTLNAAPSGQYLCTPACPSALDSLLVVWSLDQCDASSQTQQNSYTEFLPSYPSTGNCTSVSASNMYRTAGDHSCTPVLGSYSGDIGVCFMAMESCNPLDYNPDNAIKIEVTITPEQAGRITKLAFREQSPLIWLTTNGASGINNYNRKYLLRVYKNNLLVYSEDERTSEREWNLEEIDFSTNPAFTITETSTFRFELRGYCVTNLGGNMAGWEVDDIRVFGGCCTGLIPTNAVSYVWSNGETTSRIDVNPLVTTDYTVTVTDCNGCQSTDTVKATVHSLPTPIIKGTKNICIGGSTVLTASGGNSYLWSTGATSSSISVSPTVDQLYSVTVTDVNNCIASTNTTVIVNPLPSPVISGDLDICIGQSTTLTASGGSGFEWSTGATTSSIVVSPLVNTIYMVMVADANGCQEFTEVQVIVNSLPVVSISGIFTICDEQTNTLLASEGVSYLWSNGSTSRSTDVSPSVNTTYSVTVTDLNGCSSNSSRLVTVNPLPVPIINGNSTFCTGSSSVLTASGGISYAWSTGATTAAITVNPGLNTTYTVTVTDANGCTASGSRMANVLELPVATLSGDNKICEGETTTLTASGGQLYAWSNGQNTSAISVSPAVTTIYTVTVTDVNGCTASALKALVVGKNPSVVISGDNEFCVGSNTTLTATVSGTTFCEDDCTNELLVRWTLDQCNANGQNNQNDYSEFIPTIISVGKMNNITSTIVSRNRGDHSCTPDGTGGLGICFGNLNSCDPNQYDPINALRFSVLMSPKESGKLTKLTFKEQSPLNWVTANGSTGINNYNEKYLIRIYKNGNLIYSKNNINTERDWNLETFDFSDHPEFDILTLTEFTFELYGYCVVERSGNSSGWEVDDIRIFGGGCPSSPVINNVTYSWSTGATTASINVVPTSTTTYSVTVTDCNGCIGTDQFTVTVNQLPTPAITGNNIICNGASTTLTASGGTSYTWSNGENTTSITVSPSTTTTYNVTVSDANGCQASSSITVTVNQLPTPAITGNNIICNGASTTLTTSGGTSYTWSNGENTASITVSPSTTTTYDVTVTDANGCQASTTITVTVNPLPTPAITGNNIICNGASTTLTASGGTSYSWRNGENTTSITVSPSTTTTYNVTVSDENGCQASSSITVTVNQLPVVTVSGDAEICLGECTTLTATGGGAYEWQNLMSNGFDCQGAFYLGGPQGGLNQSLYNLTSSGSLNLIGDLGVNNVNGIAYYCESNRTPFIYGMKMKGTSILDAVKANLVQIDPRNANINILGEIPQPPNPYGTLGTTGIMAYIGDASKDGKYYFPAVATFINPTTFQIVDYTVYLGTIDLNNHGNGSNVTYRPISILNICRPYMDTCIAAFQTFALNPGSQEPSGGIQDWALGEDESTLYSFFGIENGLFRLNLNTLTTNCTPAPASNGPFVGQTGAQTDEFGGIYFDGNNLMGLQVDRGRLFMIDQNNGMLTLVADNLPKDYRGDNAKCSNCGSSTSNPVSSAEVTVCPTETTTYTVVVTDVNGCKSTSSITVNVNPIPNASISGNNSICIGVPTSLTASGGNLYSWSNGENTATIIVTPSITTTYKVTITDVKGCTATATRTVVVNQLPTPSIIGNGTICLGQTITLFALGGTSYAWSNGANTPNITVTPGTTTTYNVTITDTNGCQASTSVTVTVNPLPTPTISGDLNICVGQTTRLTASGGITYNWSNGINDYWQDVSPLATTIYSVTVTDANGCQASTSVTVTVNPLPTPAITGNNTICNGASTTLTASGGTSYTWNNGENTASITISPSTTTTYNLAVTDANGCQASTSITVTVNPLPNPSISGNTIICNGASTTLTASGGTSYTWNNGENTASITINPSTTTTYNVVVTEPNGCQASTSIIVTVNPLPTPSISGETFICNGASTTLTAAGGTSYVWSNGANTASITVSPSASATYNVVVTDSNGCQASTITKVTVNPLPTPAITGNNIICNGAGTTLTASGGTSYTWNNGASTASITVSPSATTTYTVTVTNSFGCPATSSITVMSKPAPNVFITGPDKVCSGQNSFLVVNGYSLNECPNVCNVTSPQILVSWDLEACKSEMLIGTHLDYSEFVPVINQANCTSVNASNVHREGINKHSCTPGHDGNVGMCIPAQNFCNPAKLDYDQALKFTVNINPLQTGQITGIQFYEQSPLNYQFVNGPGGPNNFAQKYLIRISKNGTIIYYRDEINTNRTWGLESFDFTGNSLFKNNSTATYLFELIPYCHINNGALESVWDVDDIKVLGGCCSSNTPEIMTYKWSTGATTPSISINPTTTTKYKVTVTDCCGCSHTEEYTVRVSGIQADLGPDQMINLGQSITLNPSVRNQGVCNPTGPAANNLTYLWSTGATTSTITVTPNVSSFYRLTVTDCFECTDNESVTIHINMIRALVTYPNPATDLVQIISQKDLDLNTEVRILGVSGTLISDNIQNVVRHNAKNISFNLPNGLADGVYILEIKNGKEVIRQKLIVHTY